jgi:RNA recognition motif. (a.k.a. RRM, RBD, or RNP domain)
MMTLATMRTSVSEVRMQHCRNATACPPCAALLASDSLLMLARVPSVIVGEELQESAPVSQQLSSGPSIAAAAEAAQPAALKQPTQQDDFAADDLYGDIHDGLANADSGTAATAAAQPVQLAHQQQPQQPAKPQQSPAALQQPSRPPPPVALPMQRDGSNGASASSVVFVGNLQWWTTDAELEAACAEFGPVSAVQFTEDKASGRSKGYARVHFSDATAAEQCKAGLSGWVRHSEI